MLKDYKTVSTSLLNTPRGPGSKKRKLVFLGPVIRERKFTTVIAVRWGGRVVQERVSLLPTRGCCPRGVAEQVSARPN